MDPSRPSGSASLAHPAADPPAGIYCANPDCRTRAGERSRGHQSCRALLCGHCCQNAARLAAEAGEQRPICKVHARRVHTGHKPAPKTEHRAEENPIPNATGAGIGIGGSSPAGPRLGESEELHDLLEKRARLEQSLKRSLTMVIWYRNGCEPLRIAHEVTTFPLFQLQDFPELIGELGLQPSSYIDAYNTETGQWEQHKISTVRSVEQDQRLLYRLRPSLLDSLTDCPFLDQELSLQPAPKSSLTKRHPIAPLTSSPPGKQVRVLSNPTPVRAPTTTSPQNTTLQNWDSPMSGVSPKQGPTAWSFTAPAGNTLPGMRHSPSTIIPATSADHSNSAPNNSGNIKRWPTDYTVHEIVEGFDMMAEIMKSDPSARQRNAFERVFPPCRYVKSTVGRAKLYWKRASEEIRSHFLTLPRDDPRGKWTHFVHLMDGRLVIEVGKEKISGVSAGSHGVPRVGIGPGTGVEGMVDAEHSMDTAEEDDHADTTSPLSFAQNQSANNQPQIAIQSPPTMTAHPSLSLRRSGHAHPGQPQAPPMGALLPNPNPLTHHSSAPAMPMTTTFALDRSINMNRSSSSLSGAITIPEV